MSNQLTTLNYHAKSIVTPMVAFIVCLINAIITPRVGFVGVKIR